MFFSFHSFGDKGKGLAYEVAASYASTASRSSISLTE